ncbi:uncharacterized protein LOC130560481 [Triplophysa rosa]|uniref:uncharacterized protein LOC130560481 n=1 Tax=Triplophysa rosa TaxID=992332 RepID=UPI002545DF02|nr:uncharacterized protein LOC130560481 [Triplophysa rosa]
MQASDHVRMALGHGESIHTQQLRTVRQTQRRGRRSVRPDMQLFPSPSLSTREEKKGGKRTNCVQFSKGQLELFSSSSESSVFCSVSPSTHNMFSNAFMCRGYKSKERIFASRPRAEGGMLPEFRKHKNKHSTIATRQAAEGDMSQTQKRFSKVERHEKRSPSLTTGGVLAHSAKARTAIVMTSSLCDASGAEVYGGLLSARIADWRTCAVHPWVLATISWGYRLQFAMKPPRFNGVLMSVAEGESARVLTAEIETLLNKRAIRVVPEEESRQGFYSHYFVIPKKGGTALHPILDLRVLNKHL